MRALTLALLLAGVAGAVDVGGVIRTNDYECSADSVHFFTASPQPIRMLTPNWGGPAGTVDTHNFSPIASWPMRATVFYHSGSGSTQQRPVVPLLRDTWYDLTLPGDSVKPQVKFTLPAGIAATGASALPRLTVTPNPFRDRVSFTLGLDRAEPVRADVYDAAGNRLAVIVDAALPAGSHRFEWDGRTLAEGTYFLRLRTGPRSRTVRLVRLD